MLWDMGFDLSALATASLFAFGKGTRGAAESPARSSRSGPHSPIHW